MGSFKVSNLREVTRPFIVLALIYIFLIGVSSLETGIKILGSDTQEALFSGVSNPIAALCIGILGTVLVQSSSASTSIIVGLVAAGAIDVDTAVPMIMGANIGTTVTNTLVSLGHIRASDEFRRAFAAATVHDFFNLLAVALLLPLEIFFGIVSKTAIWLSELLVGSSGSEWKSPIKTIVKEPVSWATDYLETTDFNETVSGSIMIFLGLIIILAALGLITKNMRSLVAEKVEDAVNKVLAKGAGSIAILVGVITTIMVQSSSITTSILIPLAGAGVVSLRNIYPVTLGANVGTTITALLASLATGSPEALTVALAHTTFNVFGILALYIVPLARDIPIIAAERMADIAVERRILAIVYVAVLFLLVPTVVVALSNFLSA